MKTNGFLASITGGKKVFAVSLIMALIFASLSAFSAFAATNPVQNNGLEQAWGNQFRELQADRTFYNNFRSNPKNLINSDPVKTQRYLADYAFALKQADAIVANRGNAASTSTTTSTKSNGSSQSNAQVNSQNRTHLTARQNLAMWLHEMRDLRAALIAL